MAVALAGGYSSNSTPSLGTSMCYGCSHKKTKKKKKKSGGKILILENLPGIDLVPFIVANKIK